MYVICYDISDNNLRAKIAKELQNYGRRVQYSVFECDITKERFRVLHAILYKLLSGQEDSNIRIYEICANCTNRIQKIGVEEIMAKYSREEVIVI